MRVIKPELTEELRRHTRGRDVARASPYPIPTYRELVKHTARLAYINSDYLLFFRGQAADFQSKGGGSTLYPAIYRGDQLPAHELQYRFEQLERAAAVLVQEMRLAKLEGHPHVARKRYIQWSILQHYEVVATPLLDLTHSLRVACSFAQLRSVTGPAYVYVLGLPYLTHRISIDSEQDVVNVRLLSICPPAALRPYFQEGYMAGTPDIDFSFESKTELDFRNRLIAKFVIPGGKRFWGDGFETIPESSLFPAGDSVRALCDGIRAEMLRDFRPASGRPALSDEELADLGRFMKEWVELEELILRKARRVTNRNVSIREGIDALAIDGTLTERQASRLEALRQFRNKAVHLPHEVGRRELVDALGRIRELGFEVIKRVGPE